MALARISLYEKPFRLSVKIQQRVKDVPWYNPKTSELDPRAAQEAVKWASSKSNQELQDFVRAYMIKLLLDRYDISEDSLMSRSHRAKTTMTTVPTTSIKMLGGVNVYGNRLPVMRFNVMPRDVPNQKGIPVNDRVKIKISIVRGKTRSGVPNRFLARMKSGHVGVYFRTNGSQIDEEFMRSVPEILAGNRFKFKIQKYMDDQFIKYYDRYILKAQPIAESLTFTGPEYEIGPRT